MLQDALETYERSGPRESRQEVHRRINANFQLGRPISDIGGFDRIFRELLKQHRA
jgi:hypothetical protein